MVSTELVNISSRLSENPPPLISTWDPLKLLRLEIFRRFFLISASEKFVIRKEDRIIETDNNQIRLCNAILFLRSNDIKFTQGYDALTTVIELKNKILKYNFKKINTDMNVLRGVKLTKLLYNGVI